MRKAPRYMMCFWVVDTKQILSTDDKLLIKTATLSGKHMRAQSVARMSVAVSSVLFDGGGLGQGLQSLSIKRDNNFH